MDRCANQRGQVNQTSGGFPLRQGGPTSRMPARFGPSPGQVAVNHHTDYVPVFSVDDRQAAIAKVHRMLKPGGVFVSSTVCLGDNLKIFKLIAPVGRFLRLLPILKVFTVEELIADLRAGGFEIQHRWQPGKNKGVFVVAKKSR